MGLRLQSLREILSVVNAPFGDVTVELCEKFRDYLLKCKQINHPNAYISRNSAAGYYSTFRALLKIAYKEKMLRENLNDFLEKSNGKRSRKSI